MTNQPFQPTIEHRIKDLMTGEWATTTSYGSEEVARSFAQKLDNNWGGVRYIVIPQFPIQERLVP